MFLVINEYCQNPALSTILATSKRVLNIIQIAIPIILIIWGTISIIHMMQNPEDKNGHKKIINKFLATITAFMIPVMLNSVLGLLGEENAFGACWNNINDQIIPSTSYASYEDAGDKISHVMSNPEDYERGTK